MSLRDWIDMLRTIRVIRKDRWLELMTLHVGELITGPQRQHERTFAKHLQIDATKAEREQVSQELAMEFLAVANAADRILACRQWIDPLAADYGRYRAAFSSPAEAAKEQAGDLDHGCISGLCDHLDAIIQTQFYDELRRAGSLDAARETLRYRNARLNFDLAVANVARCLLGDYAEDRPDWFRPVRQFLHRILGKSVPTRTLACPWEKTVTIMLNKSPSNKTC